MAATSDSTVKPVNDTTTPPTLTEIDAATVAGAKGGLKPNAVSTPPSNSNTEKKASNEEDKEGQPQVDEVATSLQKTDIQDTKVGEQEVELYDDGGKEVQLEVDKLAASLQKICIQNTETGRQEIDPDFLAFIGSSLVSKIEMQFAPYLTFPDKSEEGGDLDGVHETHRPVMLHYADMMRRAQAGYQPLNIGFADPIGEELRALASLVKKEGAFNREGWVYQEVEKVVGRIDTASYEALVAFFCLASDRRFTEEDAKLLLQEIQEQWPDAPKLTLDQIQPVQKAIVESGIKIQ